MAEINGCLKGACVFVGVVFQSVSLVVIPILSSYYIILYYRHLISRMNGKKTQHTENT